MSARDRVIDEAKAIIIDAQSHLGRLLPRVAELPLEEAAQVKAAVVTMLLASATGLVLGDTPLARGATQAAYELLCDLQPQNRH